MEKKRQPNFTSDELEVLLSGVEKNSKVTVVICRACEERYKESYYGGKSVVLKLYTHFGTNPLWSTICTVNGANFRLAI